ncbi:MAG: hypothetical protein A2979_03070 [Deltaproteobacteria bacterium RIFCSPLOWO2_01_FULL_45_74]|nr:MAG: hypothetical protein A2712_07335 [Deltaproteobacteria bacterium RIFCSPHIGHO2_01_FULL_43_49]OGQ15757.1 MAG: hypothetical protein A3D22_06125 [Deltaproteobacteria bacterium RIFCSPHIGHO2_02_FULL_44_53]OGQ28726.1 MAG: hypothetical protein A3D98_00860 [Deltaproteobacteria bacterium RIFCSPHIGHO2_12_FULL_44_21]OGQ32050.1 MAG: hypothetical protein A2979_03070 [Deltaproteobacteria bacterium RIFCSPLOWO2_01_FULL_45_74]
MAGGIGATGAPGGVKSGGCGTSLNPNFSSTLPPFAILLLFIFSLGTLCYFRYKKRLIHETKNL